MTAQTFRLLAEASSKAYRKPDDFLSWYQKFGEGEPDFIEKGGTKAYCFETDKERVLVFRGSVLHSLKDWQRDANLNKMDCEEGGYVHEGFAEALDLIWSPVRKWLSTAGEKQIYLTGHSLGGALAVLAASRIDGAAIHVCTFGQPRVGDADFAKGCQKKLGRRYYRFVHHRDVVPKIPPYTLGYRHFGREFRIVKGRVTEVTNGVETVDDAMRQFLGEDVEIPSVVSSVLEPLLKISEMASRPEAVAPALAMLRTIKAPLSLFGGGALEAFFEILVRQVQLQQKGPFVVGPFHDHDPEHYINAFRPLARSS